MIRNRFTELLLAAALVAVVWYYRRRERSVRESLILSQEWDAAATGEAHAPASAATSDPSTLTQVADLLDAQPAEIPERIEGLDRKVRTLTTDLEKARSAWAERWWSALTAPAPALDEPHVTVVDLADGSLDDAEAIAKQALDDALGVTIVTARGDGSLAVAVGSDLDGHRADEIAREVAGAAGGGAGGGPEFATGGGESDQLVEAARSVRDRLVNEAGFAA
mgnify:CR=1 FL=1